MISKSVTIYDCNNHLSKYNLNTSWLNISSFWSESRTWICSMIKDKWRLHFSLQNANNLQQIILHSKIKYHIYIVRVIQTILLYKLSDCVYWSIWCGKLTIPHVVILVVVEYHINNHWEKNGIIWLKSYVRVTLQKFDKQSSLNLLLTTFFQKPLFVW